MQDSHPVPHSPIPLPADIGDGPFMSAPGNPNAPVAPRAETTVFNEPTENDLLGRILYGEGDVSGIIRVADTVGPNSYKRVSRYLTIHPRADLRNDILAVAFLGQKKDINSHLINEMVDGPRNRAMATIGNAIGLANDASSNGSIFTIDGMYEIVCAPIQASGQKDFCDAADYVTGAYIPAPPNPTGPIRFNFNNGAQRYLWFEGDVGRNILISFDIVNNDPINANIIDFSVYALQMRRGTE
jgi:hypothetical protein